MKKTPITKAQIYRSVASSTAIETGVSVQKLSSNSKKPGTGESRWPPPLISLTSCIMGL